MDQNVINELLNKIKSLEERNAQIREEIRKKREDLQTSAAPFNPIPPQDDKMDVEDTNTEFALPPHLMDIHLNEDTITSNVKEYTVQYIPYDQIGTLYIMGDFTNWEMKPMNKSKGIFSFTCVLLQNFRYFYCLSSEGGIIVDMTQSFDKNPRNDQIANYIDIGIDQSKKVTCFNYQIHGNILELQRKKFMMIKAGNWDEVVFLDTLKKEAADYIANLFRLNKDYQTITNSLTVYFNKKIEQDIPVNHQKMKQILSNFKGRVIVKEEKEYEIFDVSDSESAFKCFMLYDSNHIKHNREFYLKNHLYYTLPASDILKDTTKFYSSAESIKLIEDYTNNLTDIITVHYKTSNMPISDSYGSSYYRYALGSINASKIEPDRLCKDDYTYEVLKDQIVQVKNKADSSYVQFTTVEKVKTKANDMVIYFSIISDYINIIHIHYSNQLLQAKIIEAVSIEPNEDYHIYKEISLEVESQNKLFLICKRKKPLKVYSNGVKYTFDSILLLNEHLYKIKSTSMDSSFNQFYVRIKHLPIRLLLKTSEKEVTDEVKYSTNSFEIIEPCVHENNSGGYVDCIVLFDEDKSILSDELLFAFPPCVLSLLPAKDESEFEKKLVERNKKNSSQEMRQFSLIKKELSALAKYASNESEIEKLPKEKIQKIIADLKEHNSSELAIMSYIEQNDLWEKLEETTQIIGLINTYIDLFSKYQ